MRLSWGEFLYPALQQKVRPNVNKYSWKISKITNIQSLRSYFTSSSSYPHTFQQIPPEGHTLALPVKDKAVRFYNFQGLSQVS